MNKYPAIAKNIFTFELFFILFLFAGRYKTDPRFAWIPADLTALFFGISIIGGIYILFANGFAFRPSVLKLNAIYLVFLIYALTTYIWTPGEIYASEKMLYLATLTFWPLLATSLFISSSYKRLHRFLIIYVIFATWVAVESFLAYQQAGGWTVSALGGDYLGIGRVIGPAVLILLLFILYYAGTWYTTMAGTILFGFFLYVQLISGGRGPLLATIIPMLIPLAASINIHEKGIVTFKKAFPVMASIVGIAAIGMFILANSEQIPVTIRRLNILFSESTGPGSAQARVSFYVASLNLWIQKFLVGHGIGSWPLLIGHIDIQAYPHNLILETLVEFGLIGLAILGTLFIFGIRNLGGWNTIRNNSLKLLVCMLFLNTLLNAMVSGDLTDNRIVFGALGLMMLDKKELITSLKKPKYP